MLKKHMVPLSKGGQTIKHAGKGSQQAPMPDRQQISGLASSPNAGINDYAKATPMAQPAPIGPAPGSWPGNGM